MLFHLLPLSIGEFPIKSRRSKRMSYRVGEFRDSEIIEIAGDSFVQSHFFGCEFTGTAVSFCDCMLTDCSFASGSNRMIIPFIQCLFFESTGEE